ncbi:uncharacterized protein ARMOST_12942 [Armillaria ostoyae]|uniref:Uncharacterized protein n=1 Tax=Armillaria ostoyae TaxID=47428 RepID=A0A284RLC0_ARMOS|nr:uncharacterized protein ARMOST_12942 [Armillaria ostoyae]
MTEHQVDSIICMASDLKFSTKHGHAKGHHASRMMSRSDHSDGRVLRPSMTCSIVDALNISIFYSFSGLNSCG